VILAEGCTGSGWQGLSQPSDKAVGLPAWILLRFLQKPIFLHRPVVLLGSLEFQTGGLEFLEDAFRLSIPWSKGPGSVPEVEGLSKVDPF